MLLDVNCTIANCSNKPIADFLPMKNLTGVQCFGEIEIRRRNLNHVREDNDE